LVAVNALRVARLINGKTASKERGRPGQTNCGYPTLAASAALLHVASSAEIDLQRLTADFTFQFGHLAFVDPALPVASKGLRAVLLDLTRQRCSTFGLTSHAFATWLSKRPNPAVELLLP
jgi:hypothetical protein